MLPFHTRFAAASFVASLSLASCGSGDTSLRMTPLQSVQTAPQAKNKDAYCKSLPLIDSRGLMLDARSREKAVRSDCSVRRFHQAAHSHTGNMQVFDVPGAIEVSNCSPYELYADCGTFGTAINAAGTVVGYYLNTDDVIASFIRGSDAKYTSFQAEGNQATYSYDITNSGSIAGQYFDGQSVSHAFIRYKDGSFLNYEAPWASQVASDSVSQGTSAGMVNASGESAGIYFDTQGLPHGFIRDRYGSFAQIIPTGSLTSTVCIVCLNDRGTTAGDYSSSDGITRAYVRSAAGQIRTFAEQGAVATLFGGINDANRLTGFYVDQSGVTWGLLVGGNQKKIIFQDPKASETYGDGTQPEAINNAGAVTGLYADYQGVVHGFYRSPTGEYSEFDPDGSVFTEPFSINDGGTVTGYWFDAQGGAHGFIWQSH